MLVRNPEAIAAGLRVASDGNEWAYDKGMYAANVADSDLDPHQPAWEGLDAVADTEDQWLDGKAAYLRTEMMGYNDIQGRLGIGGQYTVYNLPDNRVLKVAHNAVSARNELVRQGHDWNDTSLEEVIFRRDEGVVYVQRLCEQSEVAREIFGNPKFNGELGETGVYEQDKLSIPGLEINEMSERAQKEYINKYIQLQLRLWTLGCSEGTFNFQVNAGLNAQGDMVVGDFGEMDFSKEMIAQRIDGPRWEHAWGVTSLSPEMQQWAIERFNKELTLERLDALWGARL